MRKSYAPRVPQQGSSGITAVRNSIKFIYRPIPDADGKVTRVSSQLQQNRIKSADFGVKTFQQLQDGSLSIVFINEESHQRFNKEIVDKGLSVATNEPLLSPFEFRIHRLNASILPSVVKNELLKQFGILPVEVTIQQYSDQRFKNVNFAVVRCNKELFQKACESGTVLIEWEKYRIDTSPLPMKCKQCGLLGHTAKRCGSMAIPSEIKDKLNVAPSVSDITEAPCCADCMFQNHINRNNKFYVVRSVDHNRNSEFCKTYSVLRKKKFRTFKDVTVPNPSMNDASNSQGYSQLNGNVPSTVSDIEMEHQFSDVASGPVPHSDELIHDGA